MKWIINWFTFQLNKNNMRHANNTNRRCRENNNKALLNCV